MKNCLKYFVLLLVIIVLASCEKDQPLNFVAENSDPTADNDSTAVDSVVVNSDFNFTFKTSIQVGGEGAAEISAFDPLTNKLFVVNVELDVVSVFDITDINAPILLPEININEAGKPNSVAVSNGLLAVAVERFDKQANGFIKLYDTQSLAFITAYPVGVLPDMVAFSPDGKFVVSANEGEPNDDYTRDPNGSISIVDVENNSVETISFDGFAGDVASLMSNGFRVFGPNASLSMDIEPEYVAISANSRTAWVTLQENNGIAKVDLVGKIVEAIYPLGFKDYSKPGNEIDPSDKDDKAQLANYPVFGMFMPDAIEYVNINGAEYIITANEGDAREYEGDPGFEEEARIADILLDSIAFPYAAELQQPEVLGRLKITTTLGDPDGDGYYNELYSYGARSFTIWTGDGQMVYDSGSDIAKKTLALTPDVFNGGDKRSDDKGAEPEAVEVLKIGERYLLLVGLERNNQVMLYDITNPTAPIFIALLSNSGDEGPEGLLAISAADSPTGRDLIVVSNEVSGGVSFYEN